jgi:hypothetical protein
LGNIYPKKKLKKKLIKKLIDNYILQMMTTYHTKCGLCEAIQKNGKKCLFKAKPNGLCGVHKNYINTSKPLFTEEKIEKKIELKINDKINTQMTKLTINFMNGEKITIKKPNNFEEIKCEIFRVRKIMNEKYVLFKIGEEEKLTKYDGEDLLFCLIEIVNPTLNIGDRFMTHSGNTYREFTVYKVFGRTKHFVDIAETIYSRHFDSTEKYYLHRRHTTYKKKVYVKNGQEMIKVAWSGKYGGLSHLVISSSDFKQDISMVDLKDYIESTEKEELDVLYRLELPINIYQKCWGVGAPDYKTIVELE